MALIENGHEIVGGIIVLSVSHRVYHQESVHQVVGSVIGWETDIIVKETGRELQGTKAAGRRRGFREIGAGRSCGKEEVGKVVSGSLRTGVCVLRVAFFHNRDDGRRCADNGKRGRSTKTQSECLPLM